MITRCAYGFPGCSTGEEAYSIAIIIQECLDNIKHPINVQIFGTDVNESAIETARRGLYLSGINADISDERLKRFIIKEEDSYRIKKSIREMLVFATQNVISDPPFTKLDVICCRNLLIYFGSDLQKKNPADVSLQFVGIWNPRKGKSALILSKWPATGSRPN